MVCARVPGVIWCTCCRGCVTGPRRRGKGQCGGQGGSRRHLYPCTCQRRPLSERSVEGHPVSPGTSGPESRLRGGKSTGKAFVRAHQGPTLSGLHSRLSPPAPTIHFHPPPALACSAGRPSRTFPYLALGISGLVVEPRADHIKGCHGQDHSDATHHGSHQSHLPALGRKYLRVKQGEVCQLIPGPLGKDRPCPGESREPVTQGVSMRLVRRL